LKRLLALLCPAFLLLVFAVPAHATDIYAWPDYCDVPADHQFSQTTGNDYVEIAVFVNRCYNLRAGDDIFIHDSTDGSHGGRSSGDIAIMGGSGNDSISDLANATWATGCGPSDDECHDTYDGQTGNDYLDGGHGNDVLYGGLGADEIHGGTGSDSIFGSDYCTETGMWGFWGLYSSDPQVACSVGDGGDTMYGGAGNDWIWDSNSDQHADGVADYIDGGANSTNGVDTCTGGAEDTFVNCETVHVVPDV
jgi:Ca2+-binding RTX toxin-like protein